MKNLTILFLVFLLFTCQKPIKKHVALGTWNRCDEDGSYTEYKITDQYMLILTTKSEDIVMFKNEVFNESLILSEYNNGINLLVNNDTLVTIEKSKNKIILKSTYTYDNTLLNRSEFDIDQIDSTNLRSWKTKTLEQFKKRAESINCPDLRTEKEKITPELNLEDLEEEEIPIEVIEN
jgi:hypothetical protein